jgi:hypothetical protein
MKKIWLKPKWRWIKYQQAKACCKTESIFKIDYHLLWLVEANQQATEQASRKLWHPSLLKKPGTNYQTIILQLNVDHSFAIADISF